jgi:DNA polymerase III delta prime subunit
MVKELYAWEEKYRPRKVADLILPKATKDKLQSYVDKKQIPNVLFTGNPGMGKTAAAKAMIEEIGCDSYLVNGSLNGNIDTLRTDITQFASTVSFSPGRKYVILDEADYLNPQSFQPALRGFIQDFKENCGFILTCNWKSRIIGPVADSRVAVLEFLIPKAEKSKLLVAQFKRICEILTEEGVEHEPDVIAQVVDRFFPDMRKTIIELQAYASVNNKIDIGILASARNENVHVLIEFMKEKNFTKIRQWAAEHGSVEIYRDLYAEAPKYFVTSYIPQLVLTTAQYQFWATAAIDQEINIVAFLTEVMADAVWIQ